MPTAIFFGEALKFEVETGRVNESRVDDMVLRILTPMFSMGLFDKNQTGNLTVDVRTP
jgi:hypothetical protein